MQVIKFPTQKIAEKLIQEIGSEFAYRKAVRIANTWAQRYERTNDRNDRKMAKNWEAIYKTIYSETV